MKKQKNYFTFGDGQVHDGKYVVINGNPDEARAKMFELFGSGWSSQYDEDKWNNPSESSKVFNGFAADDKLTLAQVWGWEELKI